MSKQVIEKENVVIRFSGDSGDGMQLTGMQFSDTSAFFGNDVSTFPDYPAEIRAPQGTVGGVSGFQLHVGESEINTPGDYADVLVAMNPAALKANIEWVKKRGTIIINSDAFNEKNIARAGYNEDPIQKYERDYTFIHAPISTLTTECLKDYDLDQKSVQRTKNMFALGMVYWLFDRPMTYTEKFLEQKFKKKPIMVQANKAVLNAGYNFAETIEALPFSYKISPAKIKSGTYRNISGNTATAWGLVAAAEKAGLRLFCGSYPITPATDILQELALRKDLGVITFQAEDEIAGICTAIGASFAGCLGVTTTSGPGLALKTEATGLAIMTELPLVIVDVQRGGPSTGLPTKTEQSDLMQALHGRNGEAPLVVIAASTPSNCFNYAYMAAKIAVEHMTPVILLTDGFLANGSEPWRLPNEDEMPEIVPPFADPNDKNYLPYKRDTEKLSRQWAVPGTPGQEHRIGGLEKMDITGAISYVPKNHEKMVHLRDEKVRRVANYIPELIVKGDEDAELLVIGWGGTFGHLYSAVKEVRCEGKKIAFVHFNFLWPLPKNTTEVLAKYPKKIVCELNMGQLAQHLMANIPGFRTEQFNKVQGQPFTVIELKERFIQLLGE
jgi:2-oxoglutarate/2-oxoacid ferredoxin oxidoreductase subunit alpha